MFGVTRWDNLMFFQDGTFLWGSILMSPGILCLIFSGEAVKKIVFSGRDFWSWIWGAMGAFSYPPLTISLDEALALLAVNSH